MSAKKISRRAMLRRSGWALAGSVFAGWPSCVPSPAKKSRPDTQLSARPFRISLNTSTISGYKLPVPAQIEACAQAGFDGIQLWTRDVESFVREGGSLSVELFNRGYWENMPVKEVLKQSFEKTARVIDTAFRAGE